MNNTLLDTVAACSKDLMKFGFSVDQSSGAELYIYDVEDWQKYSNSGGWSAPYSPTREEVANRPTASANVVVDGEMTMYGNVFTTCEAPICSGRQDGLTGVTQGRNVMVQRVPHRGEINGTVRVDIEIAGVLDNAPDCLRSDGSTQ